MNKYPKEWPTLLRKRAAEIAEAKGETDTALFSIDYDLYDWFWDQLSTVERGALDNHHRVIMLLLAADILEAGDAP